MAKRNHTSKPRTRRNAAAPKARPTCRPPAPATGLTGSATFFTTLDEDDLCDCDLLEDAQQAAYWAAERADIEAAWAPLAEAPRLH